jgi:branched-chain amino acid transport system permease protein
LTIAPSNNPVAADEAPTSVGVRPGVIVWCVIAAVGLWVTFGAWPDWLTAALISKKAFVSAVLNGLTLSGLYFLVASGFTLIFGLMRNVNLAHGSLYSFGAYVGYEAATRSNVWLLGVAAGALVAAGAGLAMQIVVFRRLEGDDLRQTLVTIGISIVAADLMLATWGGAAYQVTPPDALSGAVTLPIMTGATSSGAAVFLRYPLYRLVVAAIAITVGVLLWLLLSRTRIGMTVRAGVDDRAMLEASGVNVQIVFAAVFALGAGLAGFAGVIGGSAFAVSPGEDVHYLLASLVVVIVGGMGSIAGAVIGSLLIGLSEQIGLVYFPTYSVVLTFLIMVVTLAVRPRGIMGKAR